MLGCTSGGRTRKSHDFFDDHEFSENYEFVQDGKLRSPWYDKQASEPDMVADPRRLAQEYDLNYGGSTVKVYPPELRDRIAQFSRKPAMVGEINYDSLGIIGQWMELPGGRVQLWMPLGKGRPPASRYVVGVDISAGLGGSSSSNSAIVVLDVDSGEQVLQWVHSMTPPAELAQLCVSLCKWLDVGGSAPLLVWENNGLGEVFTQEAAMNLRYSNCYRMKSVMKFSKKKTGKWGYRKSNSTTVHELTKKYLASGSVTIRSQELLDELTQFEYSGDKVVHVGDALKEDGATGKAHGDIVSALAMAVVGIDELGGGAKLIKRTEEEVKRGPYPFGSHGWRLQQYAERQREYEQDIINWTN